MILAILSIIGSLLLLLIILYSFNFNVLAQILAFFIVFIICISGLYYYDYTAAKYKADIINREYNTDYTQEEMFFAIDVIEIIKQLDRSRIEVNGNILSGEKKND